ncbi:hypothetical protein SCP_0300080 [Sparassis crispa]|uniref:Multiple myeloma tumor-associated protein 2-like N-terminal domain-containing protein n=1 Tax=Sparassis crispa TaxID=139825 RepID=A0A401GDV4_9APHY|nr:hypothetical protein SCP_0300080 [Sparassis crispa]GBE80293.1 hypothetical protein SCP_0300080 [Sparassis crispa]
MFEPVRGGTRGGQAEFKWADVSADKDRENYLGHSINAPTGRWQKNKDIHWYNREVKQTQAQRDEEIRKIKEQEAEALSEALGFGTTKGSSATGPSSAPGTGANAIGVTPKVGSTPAVDPEREEHKRRKAERKEEKRARKEQRRAERAHRHRDRASDDEDRDSDRRYGDRERSRSPRGDFERDRRGGMERGERTPPKVRETSEEYGEKERERERERDRRRWKDNARRERPGARWGRN